jgi:CheY-like chemotaxis protein/HPt (histidine-containing phosphotransfer) domain-containing protein
VTAGHGDFKLLLVEDNDINQTVALGILAQLGYEVDVAGDGLQALTMAGQHPYDAILMDCQMPKMDGYTATVELRKRTATRATPIIAMTAATFAADRQRCFDSGMDDFIAKPVRAATLQATLNRWLRADDVTAVRDHAAAAQESLNPVPAPRSEQAGRVEQAGLPAELSEPAAETSRPAAESSRPAAGSPSGPGSAARRVAQLTETPERIVELLGEGTQFDVDLVREIIASFLSRTVDLLQRLTLAVAADDSEATYLHAHSLAGAGLNLGTSTVVRISREIEADAKAGRAALSVGRLVELEVALDAARLQLRDLSAALLDTEPDLHPATPESD